MPFGNRFFPGWVGWGGPWWGGPWWGGGGCCGRNLYSSAEAENMPAIAGVYGRGRNYPGMDDWQYRWYNQPMQRNGFMVWPYGGWYGGFDDDLD